MALLATMGSMKRCFCSTATLSGGYPCASIGYMMPLMIASCYLSCFSFSSLQSRMRSVTSPISLPSLRWSHCYVRGSSAPTSRAPGPYQKQSSTAPSFMHTATVCQRQTALMVQGRQHTWFTARRELNAAKLKLFDPCEIVWKFFRLCVRSYCIY